MAKTKKSAMQALTAETVLGLVNEIRLCLNKDVCSPYDGYAYELDVDRLLWSTTNDEQVEFYIDLFEKLGKKTKHVFVTEDGKIYCRPKAVNLANDLFRETVNAVLG